MMVQASLQAWKGGRLSLLGRADPSLALLDDMTMTMQDVLGGCTVSALIEHVPAAEGLTSAPAAVSFTAGRIMPALSAASENLGHPRLCPQSPGTSLAIRYVLQSPHICQCAVLVVNASLHRNRDLAWASKDKLGRLQHTSILCSE